MQSCLKGSAHPSFAMVPQAVNWFYDMNVDMHLGLEEPAQRIVLKRSKVPHFDRNLGLFVSMGNGKGNVVMFLQVSPVYPSLTREQLATKTYR